jgi:hypothetical protein
MDFSQVPNIPEADHPFDMYQRMLAEDNRIVPITTARVKRNVLLEMMRLQEEERGGNARVLRERLRAKLGAVGSTRPYAKAVLSQAMTGGYDARTASRVPTILDACALAQIMSDVCERQIVLSHKSSVRVFGEHPETDCVFAWIVVDGHECVARISSNKGDINAQLRQIAQRITVSVT